MDTVLLFTSFFLRDPLVPITFVIVAIAGSLVLVPRARRRRRSLTLLAIAAAASVALIVSFTWLPGSGGLAALNPALWSPSRVPLELGGSAGLFTWMHGTDGPLNVLLYAPAGLTLGGLTVRLRSAVAVLQALTGTRSGQLSDVVANTIGAATGLIICVLIRALLHARALRTDRRITVRDRPHPADTEIA